MAFYVENETDRELPFSVEETVRTVCEAVLREEDCPCEAQVNLVLTDNEGIREVNRQTRGIDKPTDVLSFPNLTFEREGVFCLDEGSRADCFDPDTGELVLGDIMISLDKVLEQADEYGHGSRREFAFLVAHSMLHLCGYDHMEEQSARVMEQKQEKILAGLGITRQG